MISLFAALLAQAAVAAAPHVVTEPDWERRPSAENVARFYPASAMVMAKEGRATVECAVAGDGTLIDCKVLEEFPTDYGFGDAALRVVSLFKMKPGDSQGKPVSGGTVRVPLVFVMPQGTKDIMTSSLYCYGHVADLADREGSVEAWTAAHAWAGQLIGLAYKSESKLSALESSMARAHASAASETNTRVRDRGANDCISVVLKAADKAKK